MKWSSSAAVVAVALLAVSACGDGGDDPSSTDGGAVDELVDPDAPGFVRNVRLAVAAVEAELGEGQQYFEVTSNEQFTNVFVATDDRAAVVPYVFVDGELEDPAPKRDGATGQTFVAADILFDEGELLSGVEADLPSTTIDAISVYGDGVGAVYVLAATSEAGGFLDIIVGPAGQVLGVDPL